MADAADLKSAGGDSVWVRLPPALHLKVARLRATFVVRLVVMQLHEHLWRFLEAFAPDERPLPQRPLPQQSFLTSDEKLVVGVSGGADSLALLHALRSVLPASRVVVAHVDHGLRPTAAAEARFVQATALAWGMRCEVETAAVAALAQQTGRSLEEMGRQVRYQFFARVAHLVGATAVAVAHNADDQAETVLLHLLRGSGLSGLRGMRPVSPLPLPEGNGMWLLRPLLDISRTDIEVYCQAHGLEPVVDASNEDMTFLRNRLRHELLPLLATYNPSIKTHLQQTAAIVAADYDVLEAALLVQWRAVYRGQGEGWLAIDRVLWRGLPLSLRRGILRRAVWQMAPQLTDVTFRALELARQVAETETAQAQASLPGGLLLRSLYDLFYVLRETAVLPVSGPQLPALQEQELPIPGVLPLADGWRLAATVAPMLDEQTRQHHQDSWRVYVDVGAARSLQVRPRLPGERLQPLGMAGQSAKVKEVMINRKIPAQLRPAWPLVATADHLVWVVGHQLDQRARVTAVTQRVVQLHCYQTNEHTQNLVDVNSDEKYTTVN